MRNPEKISRHAMRLAIAEQWARVPAAKPPRTDKKRREFQNGPFWLPSYPDPDSSEKRQPFRLDMDKPRG